MAWWGRRTQVDLPKESLDIGKQRPKLIRKPRRPCLEMREEGKPSSGGRNEDSLLECEGYL